MSVLTNRATANDYLESRLIHRYFPQLVEMEHFKWFKTLVYFYNGNQLMPFSNF